MAENGTKKTSISLSMNLWNELKQIINIDEVTVSRFAQSAIRLKIKTDKIRNITEFVNSLDEKEIELLKSEIKKRD